MLTIFQVLKKIKQLDRKVTKTSTRIQKWCSHFDNEETQYNLPKLIQATNDMSAEKGRLRHALHKTNIETTVTFREKEMSLDELISLVSVILPDKIAILRMLRRREKNYGDKSDIKVVMNYNPLERDKEVDILENLLEEADSVLDNINITTEVIF